MDPERAREGLVSTDTTRELEAKKVRVGKLSLSRIPAFIFNGSTFISGSNSVKYFEYVLTDISKELALSADISKTVRI